MPIREKEHQAETDAAVDAAETEDTATEAKPSTKTPVPEGYISPVDFAKERTTKLGVEVKPQMVYGYIKNMKEFPFVERDADAKPRFIVKVPEAHDFLDAKAVAKAEKAEAAKAKAEAAAAEAAAAE